MIAFYLKRGKSGLLPALKRFNSRLNGNG